MGDFNELALGSVVFSRWQPMVVIHVGSETVLLCPLVSDMEPVHRADMDLAWHELAEAGLARVDVRFRGVVCKRKRYGLQILGRVSPETVLRMSAVACREEKRRSEERRIRGIVAAPRGAGRLNENLGSSREIWRRHDGGEGRGGRARWPAAWRPGEDQKRMRGVRNDG